MTFYVIEDRHDRSLIKCLLARSNGYQTGPIDERDNHLNPYLYSIKVGEIVGLWNHVSHRDHSRQ